MTRPSGLWVKFADPANPDSLKPDAGLPWVKCPYRHLRDRLWVRETHALLANGGVTFRADDPQGSTRGCLVSAPTCEGAGELQLSLAPQHPYAPLGVAHNARDHRLARAAAAGPQRGRSAGRGCRRADHWGRAESRRAHTARRSRHHSPQRVRRALRESINGAGTWAVNSGVWTVSFRRVRP